MILEPRAKPVIHENGRAGDSVRPRWSGRGLARPAAGADVTLV